MEANKQALTYVVHNPIKFMSTVINGFRNNQGFLLSGAIAYYTLLSVVPMLALILIVLSQITDLEQLLKTTREYLSLVAPGQAQDLTQQIAVFLRDWKLIGGIGILVLLVFSSFAFSMLENAMSVIFYHRLTVKRRHYWVSAILPYCYIFFLAIGLLVVSVVSGVLASAENHTLNILGWHWSTDSGINIIFYLFGIVGEILLLTSIYLVMPTGRLKWQRALIGGVTATFLWEITRHVMTWYFSTLSLVNVIYGTFATTVFILLSLEAASIILLLGAQVISQYEQIVISDKQE
ncbi:MAG: YihY/virulence factor BrkB family protein [Gammaproteobacteria bacterium]|nr:YihY/virulence factor BrkB family protein [Gammaproteobacteria bacterium]